MIGKIQNVSIKGIVTAVPTKIENNARYTEILGEKRVKKQTRMTGVVERRVDDGEHDASDYCISATKELLDKLNWSVEKIKVLVFVTQNPSMVMPSTAFVIQKHLGLSNDCMVFDVNLGCSGFVSGLHIVASLLQQYEEGSRGLLLAGDIQRNKHYTLPGTDDEIADQMLFGTCGTATALELDSSADYIYCEEKADGYRYKAISMKYGDSCKMDGEAVFEFAINDVVGWLNSFMNKVNEWERREIDFYLFHQAQKFMLKNIAMTCNIDMEKMLLSLEEYGNTSSGSIPLTMCLHKEKFSKEKTNLLLCGFGIGLSCALMRLSITPETVLELIESDDLYLY